MQQWRIPSAKRPGVFYTVFWKNNALLCTCPAKGGCWHIKVVRQMIIDGEEVEGDNIKRINDYMPEA